MFKTSSPHQWEKKGAQLLGTSIKGVWYPANPSTVRFRCKRCKLERYFYSIEEAEKFDKITCDLQMMKKALE